MDAWLYSDPMRCPGALHFVETNATVISYGLQTNSTPVSKRGHYEDPTFKFQIPLQIVAEREIARSLIGGIKFSPLFLLSFKNLLLLANAMMSLYPFVLNIHFILAYSDPNFNWAVRFKEFAHPAIEEFSVVAVVGPTFFLAIAMFSFVIQISSLITEKELKLRQVLIVRICLFNKNFSIHALLWNYSHVMELFSCLLFL